MQIKLVTPSYIFYTDNIKNNYVKLKNQLEYFGIYYSVKANSEPFIIETLMNCNAKYEVASVEEFKILKAKNIDSADIICSAPIKKDEMIEYLYNAGCNYFAFSSINEYEKLCRYAPLSIKVVRLNIIDLEKDGNAFGLLYNEIMKLPNFDGITFLFSSHTKYKISKVFKIIDNIIKEKNINKSFIINIGGGYNNKLGIEFYNHINSCCTKLINKYKHIRFKFYAEPGEGVVKDSGFFLTKVIDVINKGSYSEVYIDGGLPSGIIVKHGRVMNLSGKNNSLRHIYSFYDTTCLHKNLFVYALKMKIQIGDYLLFENCGAYTTCYINRFHLWSEPTFQIFKERQTFDEISEKTNIMDD